MKRRLTPLGIHLFDRGIGLNLLLDEVVILQDEMAVAPRYLSIALTNACDLECAYCYAPKHHAVLDSATIIEYAHELDAAGAIGLGFGGGEPTLFPGLDSLCRSIASETDLAVTMTTHGHWKKGLADRLSGNIHFVRISMDGLGSTSLVTVPVEFQSASTGLLARFSSYSLIWTRRELNRTRMTETVRPTSNCLKRTAI